MNTPDNASNQFHYRICFYSKQRCDPAQDHECLCWWESSDPEDFVVRSLKARGVT